MQTAEHKHNAERLQEPGQETIHAPIIAPPKSPHHGKRRIAARHPLSRPSPLQLLKYLRLNF